MGKRWAVTAVSKYKDGKGEVRDQFSRVGIAYNNTSSDGKKSISLLIGPEILLSNRTKLVLFEEEIEQRDNNPTDDEVPF